jgi:general L-amino acid transport system permease protein
MSNLGYVRTEMLPEQVPPNSAPGPIKWAQENLFSSVLNSILTIASIAFLYYILSSILPWIWNGSWTASSLKECREIIAAAASDGAGHHGAACWAVISERYLQLIYGFYPAEMYWRANAAFVLMLVALSPILFNSVPRKVLWFSAVYPFVAFWLLWGGSIFIPLGIMVGFVLAYAWMEVIGRRFGSIAGTVAAIIVPVLWWMLAVVPIDTALSGMVANARMDSMPAKLEQQIETLTAVNEADSSSKFTLDALKAQKNAFDNLPALPAKVMAAKEALAQAQSEGAAEDVLEQLQGALDGAQSELAVTQRTAGRLGLIPVESSKFGGFMLSIIIGVTGIVLSLPLGILLALGRQTNLLIVKSLCVGFIEFIRGVPLITLLFVASTLLNYFLPPGTTFDIILRVIIMVTLFAAAYMAEVIRGGLAALPTGQYEAADALGLDYWKATRLIIMPQALKISIPGIVSTFIGLFKDTVLVSIIGLMDPIGLTTNIRADAAWNGIVWELYGFVALIFFIFCFGMSRYSMYLERKLKTGH